MPQFKEWDKEYSQKRMIIGSSKPQSSFLKYLKYLKKLGVDTCSMRVLDLGSGFGKNSNYLSLMGNEVFGLEISTVAIRVAKERSDELGASVTYLRKSIGEKYPFKDEYFDLIIDVVSSNSLNESERLVYLNEAQRVLKNGGHFFVRALLKDGDKNAKNLLKAFPGKDPDTYQMPELGITERVFSEIDFVNFYSEKFIINRTLKASGYVDIAEKKYKRNYIIGYMTGKK